jgi:iron complex outermembrane receptor protein
MNQWRSAEEFPDGLEGNHYSSVLLADSDLASMDISASGRMLRLPAGALRLALGGGVRSDAFRGSVLSIEPLPTFSGSQTDLNAYGEATVPIFGGDFSFPGARRLEVSFAYRIDRYSHIGAPSNTKWGWNWEPIPGLTVRGTQGTSFKAPLVSQLDAPTTSYTTIVPAIQGGIPIDTLVMNGGSQSLRPERSRSLTAGIDWAPIGWPQFRGSMTYFNISYDDRIQSLNINATLLEEQLQGSALTFYDPSFILPFFKAPGFQQDGAGLGPSGVNAIIDNHLSNAETTVEQGIRIDGQYMHDGGGLGRWRLSFSGNYSRLDGTASEALLPQFAGVANTIAEPPRLRMRAGATWQYRAVTADFKINHSGAYKNTLFSPREDIGSWTTEDLTFKANIPDHANGFWHDFSLVLNVQNLADRRPPFVAIPAGDIAVGRSAVPFDGANASAVGRYVSLEVRKSW